jgi:hypothetical protein
MSYVLPVSLPAQSTFTPIPPGEGFVPIVEVPVPTKIQPGEKWSIDRIHAQFILLLQEKEAQTSTVLDKQEIKFGSEAGRNNALNEGLRKSEESKPGGIDSPYEQVTSTYTSVAGSEATILDATTQTTTEQGILPSPATALLELLSQGEVVYSSPIQATFRRWFSTLKEIIFKILCVLGFPWVGYAMFSSYSDLTNPVVVDLERLALRVSLSVPLSVASGASLALVEGSPLLKGNKTQSPGFVNLIYTKEVS